MAGNEVRESPARLDSGRARHGSQNGRGLLTRLRSAALYLFAVAIIAALVFTVGPQKFANAARNFNPLYAPIVAALSLFWYVLQGVRWYPLLRDNGSRLGMGDTILINLAGQSTGLLPGGELTRAVLASEAAGLEVGDTIATITVQELTYILLLVAAAVPGALHHQLAALGVVLVLGGIIAIMIVLLVPPVFAVALIGVRHLPLLRSFTQDIEELHRNTVFLLRRWDTFAWSVISALQVIVLATMFWLVVRGLDPGLLSWTDAALVIAVAYIVGAVSLLPGGLGGFEAACIGMMVAVGSPYGVAIAASLLQRGADKGLATLYGIAAYLVARKRLDLKHVSVVRHGETRMKRKPRGSQQ